MYIYEAETKNGRTYRVAINNKSQEKRFLKVIADNKEHKEEKFIRVEVVQNGINTISDFEGLNKQFKQGVNNAK